MISGGGCLIAQQVQWQHFLNDIKDHGMPEGGISRHRFKDARNLQNATHTPHGKILQTVTVLDKDDAEQQLTIAHTIALLCVASSECSQVQQVLLGKVEGNTSIYGAALEIGGIHR